MMEFIGALITFLMEIVSTGYRSLLIWMGYTWIQEWFGTPDIKYYQMFLIVLLIRIVFIDFTDVVDFNFIELDDIEEVDEQDSDK